MSRAPAAMASRIAATETVFVTTMSRTSAGSRPASVAASASRARTVSRLRATSPRALTTGRSYEGGGWPGRSRRGKVASVPEPPAPRSAGPRAAAGALTLEEVRDVQVFLGVERNRRRLLLGGEDVGVVVQQRRQRLVVLGADRLLEQAREPALETVVR